MADKNRVDRIRPAKPPIGERTRGFVRRNTRRAIIGAVSVYYGGLSGIAAFDYALDWKLDGTYAPFALTPAAVIIGGGLAYKAGKAFYNFAFDVPRDNVQWR